jgi:hypothetical protein
VHDLAKLASLTFVDDLSGDTNAIQTGHQDEVAARNTDVRRESWPFRADTFLDDLDKNLVAPAKDLLDGRLEQATATATRVPAWTTALGLGLLTSPRSCLGGTPEAHLAFKNLDLLDLTADLTFKLGIDWFFRYLGTSIGELEIFVVIDEFTAKLGSVKVGIGEFVVDILDRMA